MFDRPAAIASRLKAPLLATGAVLAAWLLAQALLFRSGAYWLAAEPDSNAGAVTHALELLDAAHRPGHRAVLVFGDSRIGEGFSGPLAARGGDVDFINLSVPGSTPRTWYYLLREIDRRGFRYDAVVVGTLYLSTDRQRTVDWPLDPVHQVALVGLRDAADYPHEVSAGLPRQRAWRTLLLPALTAQQDLRALVLHPLERRRHVRQRAQYIADTIAYGGREARMPDLRFDAAGVPDLAQAAPEVRDAVAHDHALRATPIDTTLASENAAYLVQWLDRIAARAAQHDAPTLVFPLPRGPYAPLLPADRGAPSFAQAQAMPADLFADLESPAMFFDLLHLNRDGQQRMSAVIGERVRARLDAGVRR